MSAVAILLLSLMSVQWTSQEPLSREERIERLDTTLAEIRQYSTAMRAESGEAFRDLRGRIVLDDIEQWAFPPTLVDKLSALTKKARAAAPNGDDDALNQADSLMREALTRSEQIREYWMAMPQISWRDRWNAFAVANGVDREAIDPALLSEEKWMLVALNNGMFSAAARYSRSIDQLLALAVSRSSTEVLQKRDPKSIVYVPRSVACPAESPMGGDASPRIFESADPEPWYPAGAKRRGESGSIVLRARIAESSCATAFAILVSSGYPELDAAAIKVAEASRYRAAVVAGKAVADELTFKVRFNLKDD